MTETKEKKKKIKPFCVKEILNESMPCSIWKDLPLELLENVLVCLPADVLCRFRLVCKKWNHLISQPSFAVLRALYPHQASLIFISPKFICGTMNTLLTDWHVQDPTEKHFYKFSDSFIMDSYLSSSRNKELMTFYSDLEWYKYTLAAAGELIYTTYSTTTWPVTQMHIVCNPISKSFHEIPELPRFWKVTDDDIVVMSVDNATKTYKIVILEMFRDNLTPGKLQSLFLYESMTSAWRKVCEVPNAQLSPQSGIFMKGIFYALFKISSSRFPVTQCQFYTIVLYSCDLMTGAWSKIDVNFFPLSRREEYPQLVVSLDRLYMVKFTKHGSQIVELSIWKIVLETKKVVKVTKIRNLCILSTLAFCRSKIIEMPVAVGCENSIIILCPRGRRVKFDLLKKCWQELPSHTLNKDNDIIECGILGCLVDF